MLYIGDFMAKRPRIIFDLDELLIKKCKYAALRRGQSLREWMINAILQRLEFEKIDMETDELRSIDGK